jgi:hypothetical protein
MVGPVTQLSAEQLSELLDGLERSRSADAGAGSDKRRGARLERRAHLVITLVPAAGDGAAADPADNKPGASPSLSVTMRDFSPRGIGLLIDRPLAKGTQFIAKLTRPSGTPIALLYSVAHCRQLNAHLHMVGAELTCILPEAEPAAPQRQPAKASAGNEQARIRASIMG